MPSVLKRKVSKELKVSTTPYQSDNSLVEKTKTTVTQVAKDSLDIFMMVKMT